MKTKKLELKSLKVKSFITNFSDEEKSAIKGGAENSAVDCARSIEIQCYRTLDYTCTNCEHEGTGEEYCFN